MAVIKLKKIPKKEETIDDILARFCYHFPQYKYHEAKKMPFFRIKQMLSVAIKEDAKKMYNLTRIVAAPHTKKGGGVKKLSNHFKKIIED
jgi:hypothetical protein